MVIHGLRVSLEGKLSGLRLLVGEQLLVTGAQLLAGVGNLVFVVAAAHVLRPSGYADLVAFLAVYLVVHMPTGSISAASTLEPERAPGLRRRLLVPVVLLAGLVAAAAPLGSGLLGLPPEVVVLVGASIAGAPFIALERGPLHGLSMNGRVALTLVAEPAIRLAVGLPLAARLGAVGGAAGVVLGGYAALAIAAYRRHGDPRGGWLAGNPATFANTDGSQAAFWWTGAAFLFLALFQKQDVLFANRFLASGEAATFAVIATLGGAAVLASVRVPLVLIPRAVDGSRGALAVAVGLAGGLGLGAVGIMAIAPELIVSTLFPARYVSAADLAVPYMAAMALLAVTRVLAAFHCASGDARGVAGLVGSLVVLHVLFLFLMGGSAAGVVTATLLANLVLVAVATARILLSRRLRGRVG